MSTSNVTSPVKRNGFPFLIPTVDASDVGPGTKYPLAMTLPEVMRLYWRVETWELLNPGGVTFAASEFISEEEGSLTHTVTSTSAYSRVYSRSRNESKLVVSGWQNVVWEAAGQYTVDPESYVPPGDYLYAELNIFGGAGLFFAPVVFYDGDYYPLLVFEARMVTESQVIPPESLLVSQPMLSSYIDPGTYLVGSHGSLSFDGESVTLYLLGNNFTDPTWTFTSLTATFELSTDTFLPYDGHVDTSDGSYIP